MCKNDMYIIRWNSGTSAMPKTIQQILQSNGVNYAWAIILLYLTNYQAIHTCMHTRHPFMFCIRNENHVRDDNDNITSFYPRAPTSTNINTACELSEPNKKKIKQWQRQQQSEIFVFVEHLQWHIAEHTYNLLLV